MLRTRPDRCPGVLRPWPADDGALVRVRVPGGRVGLDALAALVGVAERYGDGRVHVTARANLQVRALPSVDGALPEEVVAAVEATGLLPSRTHELVRNVLVSPQTGLSGGRADLWPVVAGLDAAICADPVLAGLPGRFLFTLDDGRGDLADRHLDLGLVALDARTAQLRVGEGWGPVVDLAEAATALYALARDFVERRGTGPDAPWHVAELAEPLTASHDSAPGADVEAAPLPYGAVPGGEHVAVGDAGIDAAAVAAWTERTDQTVITPWHGVLLPEETP
jgi:precorrin-3B synthase